MTDSNNESFQTIENYDSAVSLNSQPSAPDELASHKEEIFLQKTHQNATLFNGPFSPIGFLVPGKILCHEEFELNFEFRIDKLSLKVTIRVLIEMKYLFSRIIFLERLACS